MDNMFIEVKPHIFINIENITKIDFSAKRNFTVDGNKDKLEISMNDGKVYEFFYKEDNKKIAEIEKKFKKYLGIK